MNSKGPLNFRQARRAAAGFNHALHRIRAPFFTLNRFWFFHRFLSARPSRPARIGELYSLDHFVFMTDEQLKTLAELVILDNERITQITQLFAEMIEREIDASDDDVPHANFLRSQLEQLSASVSASKGAREKARKYFDLSDENDVGPTMLCSEPGHRVQVAINASRGPGR